MKMRLLDLFCGAGGCAVGYHRAGFTEIVGVDHVLQPRYPFFFVECDALEFLRGLIDGEDVTVGHGWRLDDFDAIHASPPCQRYSRAAFTDDYRDRHPDLLGPTRDALNLSGRPWVIENVDGAPMGLGSVRLCGLMFGLKVFRHRWFEASSLLLSPPHPTHRGKVIGKDGMCCVVGHGGGVSRRMRDQVLRHRHGAGGQQTKADWVAAMGIDWMTRNELSQAIPPAYTEFVGRQLLAAVEARRDA